MVIQWESGRRNLKVQSTIDTLCIYREGSPVVGHRQLGQSILSMLQCEFGRKLLAASSTGNFFTCNHCDTDLDEVVGE